MEEEGGGGVESGYVESRLDLFAVRMCLVGWHVCLIPMFALVQKLPLPSLTPLTLTHPLNPLTHSFVSVFILLTLFLLSLPSFPFLLLLTFIV